MSYSVSFEYDISVFGFNLEMILHLETIDGVQVCITALSVSRAIIVFSSPMELHHHDGSIVDIVSDQASVELIFTARCFTFVSTSRGPLLSFLLRNFHHGLTSDTASQAKNNRLYC